jgi:NAD-dependent deacetylase
MDCNKSYSFEWMLSSSGIPRCEKCGGVVKPYVTLYGEAPDKYTCMGACREISDCDTLIVAGTSLSVEPAASFLEYFHGRHLVVINREPTPADRAAELVIRGDVTEVLEGIAILS